MTNDLKETLDLMRTKKNARTDSPKDRFDEDRHTGSFESHGRPKLPKDPPPPK